MKKIKYIKNLLAIIFVLSVFLCNGFLSVSAALVDQENGFVEYQTEASINFNETIEVVLTDKETGYYYTHNLYRVNDYTGNPSIPFGTYSVSAQVISDIGSAQYFVTCLTDEVVIQNARVAVPIKLRVDVATGVETVLSDASDTNNTEESSAVNSSVSSDIDDESKLDTEKKDDHSLWISTLFFLVLLLLIVVAYLIFRWKTNQE